MTVRNTPFVRAAVAAVVAGLVSFCVPRLEIEEAPCPCPSGYHCCQTLSSGTCLTSAAECPEEHPPSTEDPCSTDTDCEPGEICQSWKLTDGEVAGPRECRYVCSGDHPCSTGEICGPILHDGRPLEAMNVGQACVDEDPPAGCENMSCQQCATAEVGQTVCVDHRVEGCWVALHPQCGLTCQQVQVENCCETEPDVPCSPEPALCEQSEIGARCTPTYWGTGWCEEFPCSECGAGSTPGTAFCDGNELVVCNALTLDDWHCNDNPCSCDQICVRQVTATCDNGCSDDGGAHCIL